MYNQNQGYGNQGMQNYGYGNQNSNQMQGNQMQGNQMQGNQMSNQQMMGGNQQIMGNNQQMMGNNLQMEGNNNQQPMNNWNMMKQQTMGSYQQPQQSQSQNNWNTMKQQTMGSYQQPQQSQSQNNWNMMKQQTMGSYQQPQNQQTTNQNWNLMKNQVQQLNTMQTNQQYGNQQMGGNQMQYGNQQQMGGNQMQYGNQQQMGGNQMQYGNNQQMQMGGNNQMGGMNGPPMMQYQAPTQPPQSNQGQLIVTIVGCNQLKAADTNGKSDPFVHVSINQKNRPGGAWKKKIDGFKTKTQKKTLDPVFNETFTLNVTNANDQCVYFDIFDWDRFSKNDHLGWACCPLTHLADGFPLRFDLAILDGKGSVSVSLQAQKFGYPGQYHQWCQDQTLSICSPKTCGFVKVRILSCRGLMAADMNGKSDPYCVVGIKGKNKPPTQMLDGVPVKKKKRKKKLNKTKIQKSTLNPTFQEVFKLVVTNSEQEYLQIDIYDWDRFTKDDPLGFCVFPLKYLCRGCEMKFDMPGLAVQDGTGTCQIVLEACDFGYARSKYQMCMQQSMGMLQGLNNQVFQKKKKKGKNNPKNTMGKIAKVGAIASMALGIGSMLMK